MSADDNERSVEGHFIDQGDLFQSPSAFALMFGVKKYFYVRRDPHIREP